MDWTRDVLRALEGESQNSDASVADEIDIWNLYNIILRRDPESRAVITSRMGLLVSEIFNSMHQSVEFRERVLPTILVRTAEASVYRGAQPLGELIAWAAQRLPVSAATRGRIAHVRTWAEYEEIVFGAPEFLERLPEFRDIGVDRAAALNLAGADAANVREIDGGIDVANVWEVRGWGANTKDFSEKLTIDLYADNELLGSARCADFRRDVQDRLGGDGYCGFAFAIPAALQDSFQVERRLTARERISGRAIGNPIFVRAVAPHRVDALDSVLGELAAAKHTIGKLEAQVSQIVEFVGYPIQAYGDYAKVQARVARARADEMAKAIKGLESRPSFSLVVTFARGQFEQLVATLRSVQEQIYAHWELIVVAPEAFGSGESAEGFNRLRDAVPFQTLFAPEPGNVAAGMREAVAASRGDFVLFLHAGDELARAALYRNAVAGQRAQTAAIYADDDGYFVSKGSRIRHSPRFKPDMDLDYLLSSNYVGRFVAFRREALAAIGDLGDDISAVNTVDLLLKIIETSGEDSVAHVPHVIYSQALDPETTEAPDDEAPSARLRIVGEHLARSGLPATAEPHADPFGVPQPLALRVRWKLPRSAPSVSLVIATKDHPELIGPCIASLWATTRNFPGRLEVLVVDNGTTDPIAGSLLKTLDASGTIRTLSFPEAFNWSRMNNAATKVAAGEALVFLNNDILAIADGWLEELVGQAMRPKVGAVGARLLFGDGSIQHAGIVLGVNGSCSHEGIGEKIENGGYLGRLNVQRRTSAVTGACLATRREVLARLGGFDEHAFRITFNDIDYCLKVVNAGLNVVYTPFATLHHYESVSRGVDSTRRENGIDEALDTLIARWRDALRNDPFYNPSFSRNGRPFAYLSPPMRD